MIREKSLLITLIFVAKKGDLVDENIDILDNETDDNIADKINNDKAIISLSKKSGVEDVFKLMMQDDTRRKTSRLSTVRRGKPTKVPKRMKKREKSKDNLRN